MKKILVTGANGYIGRHVVKTLLDEGHQVIACDVNFLEIDNRARQVKMNLLHTEADCLYEELGSPDVCLHMAWRDGFMHNSKNHMLDLSAHFRFLTSLIDGGLRQLAVMGTMHEVGYWEGRIDETTPCNPVSQYGIAKDALRRSMIQYCTANKCMLQWLRGYYILGDDLKNHSIFSKLLQAAGESKRTFPFTTGKTKYDFIMVDELASQIATTITQTQIAGIINCCSGTPISFADRVEQFIKEYRLDIKLEYGAFPDRPYDSPIVYGDATKIRRIMNLKDKLGIE
ncbi:NAD(P)-dependent oxidoreductase [Bacteroides intestinalis]|jgi:nucleoside-diphosphate-sugar epimerase|uniref:NAD(P)-dependent oxidoreductase n=1 Tax=Bacteroides intestinalis TaxID=329854 RepID=A0A412XRH0_9BACE|nr:NAD(P)-dependent oxidoreductase [Bacteroides intestinalis]RGV47731.1 NAD(P)-dependent oxidoreductase [Bacteroides intestinalis]RHA53659.1 NAD(P)-dependent oxidoreductase [Bacteroides intestinalis]